MADGLEKSQCREREDAVICGKHAILPYLGKFSAEWRISVDSDYARFCGLYFSLSALIYVIGYFLDSIAHEAIEVSFASISTSVPMT